MRRERIEAEITETRKASATIVRAALRAAGYPEEGIPAVLAGIPRPTPEEYFKHERKMERLIQATSKRMGLS